MSRLIRTLLLVAALPLLLPAPKLMAQTQDSQAVVLQYHHISSSTPRSTSVTADEFRQHMEYLRDNKFTVLPLPDILKALRQGTPLPDKTAAITFDDGYISVYTTAFPLLREYHWPFTVFVSSGLIGSNPKLYTSWDQLREMGAAGATLANHSVTHPYLLEHKPGEDEALWLQRIEHEIVDAEQKILQETGQSHKIHAYPYGEYNLSIKQLLTRLGYIGMGQQSGPINAASDFEALPRFPFSGIYTPIRTFAPKMLSLAFNVSIVEPADLVTGSKQPGVVLAFNGNYRFDALACFVNDHPMQVTAVNAVKQQYRIVSLTENAGRRFRYNCTAPGRNGRYYWFTVPWVNPALPDN